MLVRNWHGPRYWGKLSSTLFACLCALFAVPVYAGGFLFEVTSTTGQPAKMYLFGTLHLGTTDTLALSAPVLAALARTDQIALEANPLDQPSISTLIATHALLANGDTIEKHLPPALLAQLGAYLAAHDSSITTVSRFKPWMVTDVISIKEVELMGFEASRGSEDALAQYAGAHALPLLEIEGMARQIEMFDATPEALQDDELKETLDEIASGQAQSDVRELLGAWQSGTVELGQALVRKVRDKHSAFDRYFVEVFLDQRNRFMLQSALGYLHDGTTTFFAVGSLHLFGPTGLIRGLEKSGYRVTSLP
jgi:uncharacterized protein